MPEAPEKSARDSGEPKPKIFISYSRKDLEFANRLETALQVRGFEPLIDRSNIFAFEDWWSRIQALIAMADTVAFVLSPDATSSEVALMEVTFSASLNKRFAPIVYRPVDDNAVPKALARLNFIFFDDPTHFDASMEQLIDALRTDIDWVRKHTEFGEHARRWQVAGRPGPEGLLLRSPMLEAAEDWIADQPRGAPMPTEITEAFIRESRRAAEEAEAEVASRERWRRFWTFLSFAILASLAALWRVSDIFWLGLIAGWLTQKRYPSRIRYLYHTVGVVGAGLGALAALAIPTEIIDLSVFLTARRLVGSIVGAASLLAITAVFVSSKPLFYYREDEL